MGRRLDWRRELGRNSESAPERLDWVCRGIRLKNDPCSKPMTTQDGFLLGGRILIGLAVACIVYRIAFLTLSAQTTGVVTGSRVQNSSEDGSKTHLPQFEFRSEAGELIKKSANLASSPKRLEVGDPLRVRYLRFNPAWAVIDSPLYLWFMPIFLCGMGSVLIVMSVGVRWFQKD